MNGCVKPRCLPCRIARHDLAQHVAAPFVGRDHAVRDEERRRAHVIRDDAQRQRRQDMPPVPGVCVWPDRLPISASSGVKDPCRSSILFSGAQT